MFPHLFIKASVSSSTVHSSVHSSIRSFKLPLAELYVPLFLTQYILSLILVFIYLFVRMCHSLSLPILFCIHLTVYSFCHLFISMSYPQYVSTHSSTSVLFFPAFVNLFFHLLVVRLHVLPHAYLLFGHSCVCIFIHLSIPILTGMPLRMYVCGPACSYHFSFIYRFSCPFFGGRYFHAIYLQIRLSILLSIHHFIIAIINPRYCLSIHLHIHSSLY